MTSPLAEFLNGAASGFRSGHEFHEGLKERRSARALQGEELAYMRERRRRQQFEQARGDAEHAQETGIEYVPSRAPDMLGQFDEGVRGRADRLRRGVGDALVPRSDMAFRHFGDDVELPRVRGAEDRIQFGGFEKVRLSAAEQTAQNTEEHQAELAAAVGNYLSKHRPDLGIEAGTSEATLLGMGRIPLPRPQTGNIDPRSPEGMAADAERKRRGLLGTGSSATERRQDLGTVERQLDDTRTDLARAERAIPAPWAPSVLADSATYERGRADAVGRANVLRQRADSLGTARDSMAANVQGRPFTRSARGGAAPDALLQQLGQQFNWDEAKVRQELIKRGYDPDAE